MHGKASDDEDLLDARREHGLHATVLPDGETQAVEVAPALEVGHAHVEAG
jgi:hypothetical protein